MTELANFTELWNTDSLTFLAGAKFHTSSTQQGYKLRPSRLGRPAYITAMEHLINIHSPNKVTFNDVDSTQYGRRANILDTGHRVEQLIVEVMRNTGVTSFEYQVPVTFELGGYVIEGTADLVMDDTVIDIKTASASNYKRMISGYNLTTYITQLGLYAHGLGLSKTALLLYNKDTSELYYKPVFVTNQVTRVEDILHLLKTMEQLSLQEGLTFIYNNFEITDPIKQMRQKEHTGRYLVPGELLYAPTVRDLLWNTYTDKGTTYIESANEDTLTLLENM